MTRSEGIFSPSLPLLFLGVKSPADVIFLVIQISDFSLKLALQRVIRLAA